MSEIIREEGTLLVIEAQLPRSRATDNFWKSCCTHPRQYVAHLRTQGIPLPLNQLGVQHMYDWFSPAFIGSQGGVSYFDEKKLLP